MTQQTRAEINTLMLARINDNNNRDITPAEVREVLTNISDSSFNKSDDDPNTLFASSTGAFQLPDGTTAQRPTAAVGMLRYNTTTRMFEGYDNPDGWVGMVNINMLPSALKNLTDAKALGKTYSAYGDGTSRTVESLYGTLAAAQVDYPNAVAGEEIDCTVIRYAIINQLNAFLKKGTYLFNKQISTTAKIGWLVGEEGTIIQGLTGMTPLDSDMISLNTSAFNFRKITFDNNHCFRQIFNLPATATAKRNTFEDCSFINSGLTATTATAISGHIHCSGTPIMLTVKNCYFGKIVVKNESNAVYGTYGAEAGGGRCIGIAPSSSGYTDAWIEGNIFYNDDNSEAREIDQVNQNANAVNGPGTYLLNNQFYYGTNVRRCGKHHTGIMVFDGGFMVPAPGFTAAAPVGGDPQSEVGIRCKQPIDLAGSGTSAGLVIVKNMYIDATGFPDGILNSGGGLGTRMEVKNCTLKGSRIKYSRFDYETSANQTGYSIGFRDAGNNSNQNCLSAICSNCHFLGWGVAAQLINSNSVVENCYMDDPLRYGFWVNVLSLTGTMQAGSTSTTAVLATGATSTNDILNNRILKITGGTGSGQWSVIQDYDGPTRTCTMSPAWGTTPDNTSTYEIGAANIRISGNTIVSRTPGSLTIDVQACQIQGNKGTQVFVYNNLFIRAGNNSSITRFIRPANDVLGSIHDNTCVDPTITCVDITSTNTQAKIYNNNDQPHVRADTSTAYTITQSDHRNYRTLSNAGAITCTLPNNLPAGTIVTVEQLGAGQVTFSAASGATLVNYDGHTKTAGQYAVVLLRVRTNSTGTNAVWVLEGKTGV